MTNENRFQSSISFLAKKNFTQKLAQKHMQKNLEPQEIGAYYFFGGEWICILKMMSGLHFFQPRLLFSKLKELRAIYELILRPPAHFSIVWDSSTVFVSASILAIHCELEMEKLVHFLKK